MNKLTKIIKLTQDYIFLKNTDLAISLPEVNKEKANEVTLLMSSLIQNIIEIIKYEFDNKIEIFCKWLGYQDDEIEILKTFCLPISKNIPMRIDLYQNEGQYKLLEINAGPNLGGLAFSIVQRFIESKESLDPLQIWVNWIKNTINYPQNSQQIIAIIEDKSSLNQIIPRIIIMKNELQKSGIHSVIISPDKLAKKDDGLYYNEQKISWLYNLFDIIDIKNNPNEYKDIISTIKEKKVNLIAGFEGRIIGNKSCLTMVYNDRFTKYFNKTDLIKLRNLIPETNIPNVDNLKYLINNKNDFTLKPCHGHGGELVECGWNIDKQSWINKMTTAVKIHGKYIVQKRVNPQIFEGEIFFCNGKGVVKNLTLQGVQGIFIFESKLAGGFWRVNPEGSEPIINFKKGAIIGHMVIN